MSGLDDDESRVWRPMLGGYIGNGIEGSAFLQLFWDKGTNVGGGSE